MNNTEEILSVLDKLVKEEPIKTDKLMIALSEAIKCVKMAEDSKKILKEWGELINHIRSHIAGIAVEDRVVQSIYQTGEMHILEIVEYHRNKIRR